MSNRCPAPPLFRNATIILSTTGRLRYVSGRALWRLEVSERTPRLRDDPAAELQAAREACERLAWQRRYQDAVNREPKTLTGPLVPIVPSSKRWNQLPKEIP